MAVRQVMVRLRLYDIDGGVIHVWMDLGWEKQRLALVDTHLLLKHSFGMG